MVSYLLVEKEKGEVVAAGSAAASSCSAFRGVKGCSASHLQMGHRGFRADSH
jgi:hypothetical protein